VEAAAEIANKKMQQIVSLKVFIGEGLVLIQGTTRPKTPVNARKCTIEWG
jgi:hypothetical protein